MASVYQLTKPNRLGKRPWVVEYTDAAGKRRRATPKSGLKKDADALRRRIEAELDRGEHLASSESVTFAAATEDFLRECERRAKVRDQMTYATVNMYRTSATRMLEKFGTRKVQDLTSDEIQTWIGDLTASYSAKTVRNMGGVIKVILDHAVYKNWSRRNPLRIRRLRLPSTRKEVPIPTHDELKLLLTAAEKRLYDDRDGSQWIRLGIVTLGAFGGLRIGEMAGLHWSSVDFERNTLTVRHSHSRYDGIKEPKTKAGVRTISMAGPLRRALERLRDSGRTGIGGPFVFNNRNNIEQPVPMGQDKLRDHHYEKTCRECGLVNEKGRPLYSPHKLRHAAVSLLIEEGVSALHIKSFIGHASVATTLNIYGHLFPSDETVSRATGAIAARLSATNARHA